MDNETEVIKQQMEETRESLSDKLGALEQHVMSTVQDTTDSVANTVETVKDAVQGTVSSVKETVAETVDTVKEAFDIPQQVERHPWAMFAGAVLVGYVGGRLLAPPRRPYMPESWGQAGYRPPEQLREEAPPSAPGPSEPSWLEKMGERFEPALDKLKELAINASAGLVGEMIMSSVGPGMKDQVADVIDEVAKALGARPPNLETAPEQAPSASTPRQEGAPLNRVRAGKGNGRRL